MDSTVDSGRYVGLNGWTGDFRLSYMKFFWYSLRIFNRYDAETCEWAADFVLELVESVQ